MSEFKLRAYQEKIKQDCYDAWEANPQSNNLIVMPTGAGKCLGKNTPVLLYDGTVTKVQDVKVGDLLMGPDSNPRRVLSVCKGVSPLYKIEPTKGEPWVCNDVHVLTLQHTESGVIIDIPLDEYLTKADYFKHCFKQIRVGVNWPERYLEFEPYFLGLFLAEGCYISGSITNPDFEVHLYLLNWAKVHGMDVRVEQGRGCQSFHFSNPVRGWFKNRAKKVARICSTKSDRWIPREFLINSRENRLQLLAGLLDGDGYLSHNGFEIITKYDQLAKDILFLARSLGFAAYCSEKTGTIASSGFSGEYHRITISGDTDLIPNKIRRKQAQPRKQKKSVLRTGFKVVPQEPGEYFGFTLNGDGRFLLGDFTVTHNTVTFSSIAQDFSQICPTAIMVHRKELVQQICLTLSSVGLEHNVIAPSATIRSIISAQRTLYKRQFYNYNAPITVVSVDTLNARILKHQEWARRIGFWICDEAAHVLKVNKWGEAINYFPNARGLGVTATPQRLDRRGLGRHADGVFDLMIEGPRTRWLIENGFLSRYMIAIPESKYREYLAASQGDADYSKAAMLEAARKSQIVGDVFLNYQKHAQGTQAIIFADSIETGKRLEEKFNENKVPAKLLTSENTDEQRFKYLNDYREQKIKVLVNIDLFDEGLDVPGIETVIMARPTKSLSKYLQTVGRGLRIAANKPHLILIDHVGNVDEHGLPDSYRRWTLDRVTRRRTAGKSLVQLCRNPVCNRPFERLLTVCPYCHHAVERPADGGGGRVGPKQVDGDLVLLDPDVLRELEQGAILEAPAVVAQRVGAAAGPAAAQRALSNQIERIATQRSLVESVAAWAGVWRAAGYSDRTIHKKFFFEFDMTIHEALALDKQGMESMKTRIDEDCQ